MGTRKDEPIYQYCLIHPEDWERSADYVAKQLGMDVTDLRARVHVSRRLQMRAVCLGWHVVEVAEPAVDPGGSILVY